MKIRIISLVSSLLFLFFLSFQNLTCVHVIENSSSTSVEYFSEEMSEERLEKINFEYIYLLSKLTSIQAINDSSFHLYEDSFYTYKSINNLFRPPIS